MNYQQPTHRTIRRNVASARPQYTLNGYGCRVWAGGYQNLPHAVKGVSVPYMNKLYQGIGFRNDNGGIEFYSEDCKKRLSSKIEKDIDVLRKRLIQVGNKLESTCYDIALARPHIAEWRSSLQHLEEDYLQVQGQIASLSVHPQTDLFADMSDKIKLRNKLLKKLRLIDENRNKQKNLLEYYQECVNYKGFLEYFVSELSMKIEQKQKDALAASTLSVQQHGILTLTFLREMKSKACCVFADVLDYLAYVHLANDIRTAGFPMKCDCAILNNPRNFLKLLLHCDTYDQIYCFYPNTISGKTMEETMIKRHGARAVSMSRLYAGHVTLFEYSMSIDNYSPLNLVL